MCVYVYVSVNSESKLLSAWWLQILFSTALALSQRLCAI